MRLPTQDPWAFENPLLAPHIEHLRASTRHVRWVGHGLWMFDERGQRSDTYLDASKLFSRWTTDPGDWITAGLRSVHQGRPHAIEHTSVNPVHPLHIAALRGSLIGNGIAELIRLSGGTAVVHYFVNDIGRQAQFASWILPQVDRGQIPDSVRIDEAVGLVYSLTNMIYGERVADIADLVSRHPWLLEALGKQVLSDRAGLAGHLASGRVDTFFDSVSEMTSWAADDLSRFGIAVDVWERESRLGDPPKVDLSTIGSVGRLVTINGGLCLATEAGTVSLLRPVGRSMYFLRDIANLLTRTPLAQTIHVIGSDQTFLQRTLTSVAKAFGRHAEHVPFGIIKIDGKLSSARRARLLTVDMVRQSRGDEGLASLALALVGIRRTRPMDISAGLEAQAFGAVVEATRRIRKFTSSPSESSNTPLSTLCLRAPGILATSLLRRDIHISANLLIALSNEFLAADSRGQVDQATFSVVQSLHESLLRVCGMSILEKEF